MSTFATCGTTTAKGLYANIFFVLAHYAFGGVSAQCVLFALSTPLRLRGRIGVFRRREGPVSVPFSLGSPSSAASSLSSVRGFFSSRGWPPADPVGIRPPFVIKYVFVVVLSYTRGGRQPGPRSDVFPGRDCVRLRVHCCIVLVLLFAAESTCSSMAWGSTVFGVAGLVIYFEGRKVVQWVLAHWLVLSCIHSLEPTKTSQATGGAVSDCSGI